MQYGPPTGNPVLWMLAHAETGRWVAFASATAANQ